MTVTFTEIGREFSRLFLTEWNQVAIVTCHHYHDRRFSITRAEKFAGTKDVMDEARHLEKVITRITDKLRPEQGPLSLCDARYDTQQQLYNNGLLPRSLEEAFPTITIFTAAAADLHKEVGREPGGKYKNDRWHDERYFDVLRSLSRNLINPTPIFKPTRTFKL